MANFWDTCFKCLRRWDLVICLDMYLLWQFWVGIKKFRHLQSSPLHVKEYVWFSLLCKTFSCNKEPQDHFLLKQRAENTGHVVGSTLESRKKIKCSRQEFFSFYVMLSSIMSAMPNSHINTSNTKTLGAKSLEKTLHWGTPDIFVIFVRYTTTLFRSVKKRI